MEKLKKNVSILVSVIVPTYKRRTAFLGRCIDSLLAQTHKNIEIVIVDDNNTDSEYHLKTKEFVDNLAKNTRVNYLKTPRNLGAALSRNFGIEKAQGKYITFLDDDDVYLPKKIEMQLNYMHENGLDMSFTDLALFNQNDKLIDYRQHDYITSCDNDFLLKQHIMHNLTGTPTFMFLAENLKKIGGFNSSIISNEYYLMEKAINSGLKIGYIPKSFVIAYRHTMGSLSYGEKKIEGEKLLFQSKKKYFDLLTRAQIRYTKCRYFSVMALSYYRNKRFLFTLIYSFCAFFSGPDIILKEIKKRKNVLQTYRKGFGQ